MEEGGLDIMVSKVTARTLILIVVLLLLPAGLPGAFGIYSGNYRIDNPSINSGGGEMSGIQHRMAESVIRPQGFGAYSSASYRLEAGCLPAGSGTGVRIESNILSPAGGGKVYGTVWTITGSATSPDGVAFVDVSTDGGRIWENAVGTGSWSYDWDLPGPGTYNIRSRATDSHNNVETPSAGVTVDVVPACSLSVFANPTDGGIVMADPAAAIYPSGQQVRLTAAANSGYLFDGWSGEVADTDAASTAITMGADRTVTANFTARDGIDLSFGQDAKTVTLVAEGFSSGAPFSDKTFNFYKSTYSPAAASWSAWARVGSAVSGADGMATKSLSMGNGTYRFKAAYEPSGAEKVESLPTSDCVIASVTAVSPMTKTVTAYMTPSAAWTAFTGAAGYAVQTCPNKYFKAGVSENTVPGGVTTGDLPALARGVKTFWRVIAILPAGRSIPSKPWLITYKEGATLTGLSDNKSGMTVRPSVTLAGNDSGALLGKKIYFYYKNVASARWLSAGYGFTDAVGFAQPAAAKTLAAGDYDLKAMFKGDIEYFLKEATGSFTLN